MNPPDPTPSVNSDLQLVERTVAGDQRAYELLVIKYQRRIERLIGRMVRDVDLVQDIAQDVFARLSGLAPVSRGCAVLYLAVPDRGQYGEKDADGPQARPVDHRKRTAQRG